MPTSREFMFFVPRFTSSRSFASQRLILLQFDLDFFEPCGAGDAAECLPLLLLLLAETANRYASPLAI